MTYLNTDTKSGEKGFTLVELAIVMIIIGLLIGGILKGQELISNARVAATATQIKGFDAAINTFRDSYSAFPGDMVSPNTRLPDCTGACAANPTGGDTGNGRIEQNNFPIAAAGNEAQKLWLHLNAANVISGVQNVNTLAYGEAYPGSDVGGGYQVSFSNNGDLPGNTATANARVGHYILLSGALTAIPTENDGVIAADLMRRVDEKTDDGAPNTGSVLALGSVRAVTGCAENGGTAANQNIYPVGGGACGAYFRIQQ